MSEEPQRRESNAVELLWLRDELDALDQIVPARERFRFGVLVLFLFPFLWALGALAYVPFLIIFGGLVVYERRARSERLLGEREVMQNQIRQIEDAQDNLDSHP